MLSASNRTTLKKAPHKAVMETEKLHQIIDESLVGHVAIVEQTGPLVLPLLAWRVDNDIYIHGANNSRLFRRLAGGQHTCVTFTLFDGWVLARSAFHHSAHYRSAVVFGSFTTVTDNNEKDRVLNHFIEQIAPQRTKQVRLSSSKELAATQVLRMPLAEASVKISNGPVNDDKEDMALTVWAGFMPYRTRVGPLIASDDLAEDVAIPDYSMAYGERWTD